MKIIRIETHATIDLDIAIYNTYVHPDLSCFHHPYTDYTYVPKALSQAGAALQAAENDALHSYTAAYILLVLCCLACFGDFLGSK